MSKPRKLSNGSEKTIVFNFFNFLNSLLYIQTETEVEVEVPGLVLVYVLNFGVVVEVVAHTWFQVDAEGRGEVIFHAGSSLQRPLQSAFLKV